MEDNHLQSSEKAGYLQEQHLNRLAELKKIKPKVSLLFIYSENCPHCARVKPILEAYVEQHPEISLTELKVESKEIHTHLLEALLKGEREVPLTVVNGRFLIRGDKDFLARLTYTIKIAEKMPPTTEERVKWLFQK